MRSRRRKKNPEAIVKVSQPAYFKGFKLGVLVGDCKYGDGGKTVYLFDKTLPYREVCIQSNKGDSLEIVSRITETL